MERIRTIADSLGLNYTLEKITDDGAIDRRGLQVPCMFAYCHAKQLKENDCGTILKYGIACYKKQCRVMMEKE